MRQIIDAYNEIQAEVMHLRRELLFAQNRLLLWMLGMFVAALAFGLVMFIAGANSEATRAVMKGMK